MITFDVTGPRCPVPSEEDAGWPRSGGWGAASTILVHLSASWTDREGQDDSKVTIMTILWTDILCVHVLICLHIFTNISDFETA